MKIKLWCCVNTVNTIHYYYPSLAPKKTDSISMFTDAGEYELSWKLLQELGWKCIRVEIEIKPLNKIK